MKTPTFFLRSVLPALLALFLLTVGVAGPAAAAQPVAASVGVSVASPAAMPVPMASATLCGAGSGGDASTLLPVNRWSAATTEMHSRVGGFELATLNSVVQRNLVVSSAMSAGNTMWSGATQVSSFAVNFCGIQAIGGAVDGVTASIGTQIISNPLFVILLAVTIGFIFVNGMKHGGGKIIPQMISKAVVIAFIVTITAGAMASTGGGKNGDNGPYKPGYMSPGWFAVTANDMISTAGTIGLPAMGSISGVNPDPKMKAPGGDITACEPYINAMKLQYVKQYGGTSSPSMIPLILNGMWEDTGLKSWKSAQFGNMSPAETEGAYCHLLEMNASTPVTNFDGGPADPGHQRSLLTAISGVPGEAVKPNSKAFTPGDATMTDRSIIGWAACKANGGDLSKPSSWSTRAGFGDGAFADGARAVTSEECADWWNNENASLQAFDWGNSQSDIEKMTIMDDGRINANTRSFLLNLHGNDNSAGLGAAGTYMVSAFFVMIVFSLLAIAAIAVKLAVGAYSLVLLASMVGTLLPGADSSGLLKKLRTFGGLIIIAAFVHFFYAVIAGLTMMISSLVSDGSVLSVLITGFAPVLACIILHAIFKGFGKPSPFSPSSAVAYAGSITGSGDNAMKNLRGLMDSGVSSASKYAKAGTRRAAGAATGGRVGGRRDMMAAAGMGPSPSSRRAANRAAGRTREAINGGVKKTGMSTEAAKAFKGVAPEGVNDIVAEANEQDALKIAAPKTTGTAATGTLLSGVANSQMGKVGADSKERHQNALAASHERSAAKKFNKGQTVNMGQRVAATASAEAMGLKATAANFRSAPVKTGAKLAGGVAVAGAKTASAALPAISKAYHAAGAEFRNKPLKTSAKYAAGAAALVVGGVPLAGIAAGAMLAKPAVKYAKSNMSKSGRDAKLDRKVNSYRDARVAEVTAYKVKKDEAARKQSQEAKQQRSRNTTSAPAQSSAPAAAPVVPNPTPKLSPESAESLARQLGKGGTARHTNPVGDADFGKEYGLA